MVRTGLYVMLGLVANLAARPVQAAEKISLDTLLRQMTDLSLLAEFPEPAYVARQFSSYDRASVSPKDPVGWFANYDRGYMLYGGVVMAKTPYFKVGPQQGRKADGYFTPGTKVGIAPNHKAIGTYVWAYATAADGRPVGGTIPQGYVAKSAVKMNADGHVLAEMDGPGCLVRIWSANPSEAGNCRIFLDHARQPAIDAPLDALLGGKWQTQTAGKTWTPFPDPIACERSKGFNLYFPIAYAQHCRICVDKPNIYYHVDYRTYPKGTAVETFSLEKLAKLKPAVLATVEDRLKGQDYLGPAPRPAGWVPPPASTIGPAGRSPALKLQGPRVVHLLYVDVDDYRKKEDALRSLVLIGTFDGASKPQIWCPLGDFFGSSPGVNPYRSLPFDVAKERQGRKTFVRLVSRWPMPFQKSAVFEIQNLGRQPMVVTLGAFDKPYKWTDRSLHFHAKWRTETMKTRPFRDWSFCQLRGRGVFVGDMLSVMNPSAAWWGEGDEKIYVDGEAFPSWFGTGTEDYFGYAWSDPRPFQHGYHNQTRCDGPGTYGHTSVNRFHILDNIPFTSSFRFDMEVWHWAPNIEVNYAATSYWYARPGAGDDFKPVATKVLQTIPSPPPPYKIAGAIEGEQMKFLAMSSRFEIDPQLMVEFPDGKWSGNMQLWARPTKVGEWVDLRLPVAADGRYRVFVYLTKAQDYGIVQFHMGGKPLGKPIDCFNSPKVISTGPIELGTAALKKGGATLRVQVTGTNPKSVGVRYMWGLDCVVLKPTDR